MRNMLLDFYEYIFWSVVVFVNDFVVGMMFLDYVYVCG